MDNTKNEYRIEGSLWMSCNGDRFFGPGRMELLGLINETGSINKAAKKMKMSYKKAWGMVEAMNSQAPSVIVITKSGGEQGGGSYLTETALQLMMCYNEIRNSFKKFIESESLHLQENSLFVQE